ncbi:MAG TPA: hypothetical protein DCZ95_02570 [Verrucomicrobia bacterium]|nr:MAG: hypothetical protein A2X46_09115 [Lentisphaerae bacterium GWF2_57_35]HBA82957.1 hypothetical protein [Verrucomicrobiota bacterium]
MKMRRAIPVLLLQALLAVPVLAADVSSFRVGESLLKTERPERWSIGVQGLYIDRDVELDSANSPVVALKAKHGALSVGYDFLPWLTASLSAGATDGKVESRTDFDEYNFSWGANIQANVWSVEVAPVRFTLKGLGDYTYYRMGSGNLDWYELMGAGTINVEFFVSEEEMEMADIVSMVCYVGPAISTISGSYENGAGNNIDFSEDQSFGALAGVDIYLTKSISIGGNVQYFSAPSWGGRFSWHF